MEQTKIIKCFITFQEYCRILNLDQFDIYLNIQRVPRFQALWRSEQAGRSCHDHGKMALFEISLMRAYSQDSTYQASNHTFDSQLIAQVL